MRWFLPLCFALGILQVAACGSGSNGMKGIGDAGGAKGTGGSSGAQMASGAGFDAGKGGTSGSVGVSGTFDSTKDGSTPWTEASASGGSAPDAAIDALPTMGGAGGGAGSKGGSGGSSKTSGGGDSGGSSGVVPTGGTVRDGGPGRDGDRSPPDTANDSHDDGPAPDADVPGNCPSNRACFVDGEVQGLFSGWGWVDMGLGDTLTNPTCGDDKHSITVDNPCTTWINWNSGNALCMTGSIPPISETATDAEYLARWGVEIRVGGKDPNDAAIGPAIAAYKTIAFFFSNPSKVRPRAILHRRGDPKTRTYCKDDIKSGVALDLKNFNTLCWGEPTTQFLKPEEIQTIDYIAMRVLPLGETTTFENLCLTGLSFQ